VLREVGDVAIAYQVVGEGPFDVVYTPPFVSHVEPAWEPGLAAYFRRLASFCRFIRFDTRGTGMSDRVGHSRRSRRAWTMFGR
jgi:hypothetical protein